MGYPGLCFYFSNTPLNHTLFIDGSAMPTIHSIDEKDLTEAGQDGKHNKKPPCPERQATSRMKDTIMNSKLLYAATVAVSLISTLALADEATPLTRAQVNAELSQAISNGTLQRTDYDTYKVDAAIQSTKTRDQVAVELSDAKAARKALKGPDANRTYNQYGMEAVRAPSTLTRAEVKADLQEAIANGTLQRTDYDDPAIKGYNAVVTPTFAQRVKATFSRKQI
jgi:hypothetical protein